MLTIAFDAGRHLAAATLAALFTTLDGEMQTATGEPRLMSLPLDRPAYRPVYCSSSYAWADPHGSFSWQRACGSKSAPWGWIMMPSLRAIVVGNIIEDGLNWTQNVRIMPKNARHIPPASYLFHGTMSGVVNGGYIHHWDNLTFRVNVGEATDTAYLNVYGYLHVMN